MNKNFYLIFIMIAFSCTGCFRRYEVYGFKSSQIKLEWGTVGAKLIGDQKSVGYTTKIGSPYELLLWFDSMEFSGSAVAVDIKEITLSYFEKDGVIFQKMSVGRKKFEKYDTGDAAYFSFDNIELDYRIIKCCIHFFIIKSGGQFNSHIVEIPFITDYKKFWRIIGA